MGFPMTSVLDNFNRANTGPPPSSSWDYPTTSLNVGLGLIVSSNLLKVSLTGGGDADSYWKTVCGPDCEAYFTITTFPSGTQDVGINLRGLNPGAGGSGGTTFSGYEIDVAALNTTATLKYFRADSNVYTQLGSTETPGNFVAGDKFGVQMIGSTVQAWRFHSGAWATYGASRTDATYGGAGIIGAIIGANATTRLDDFGGGTLFFPPFDPRHNLVRF